MRCGRLAVSMSCNMADESLPGAAVDGEVGLYGGRGSSSATDAKLTADEAGGLPGSAPRSVVSSKGLTRFAIAVR